jgi:hypothetical protein
MPRDPAEFMKIFAPLFSDLGREDSFPKKRPLLAHYTSVGALEAILRNNEVWFSNPLFMNDMEEVRFGINVGANMFVSSAEIEASCGTPRRFEMLKAAFNHFYNTFANEHVLDLYVFCLSEHAKEDKDGLLSMWRGYGGNGSGAAIVFDTAKIEAREGSPLIIANVHYGAPQERTDWLRQRISEFAGIVAQSNIEDDQLWLAAYYFFEHLKLFAVFSKHRGFREENEWRVVYMRDRDTNKAFDSMFSYWVGPRGVEQKLKLKIAAIPGFPEIDVTLDEIVERIILGPSLSTPLARGAVLKMLDSLGLPALKERVTASTIPFRAA